jgi:5,5'-dehydrodivanillate O-demethylase oxygenase subunit
MLTAEDNELLTRVGPGTPMGNLLRRYWHPVAMSEQMRDRWTKRVRILGEDLVLFRDRSGRFGLIAESCPHRRASLAYGIPAEGGIRCPYHGWKFDGTGRCLEQPNEPEDSNFKDKVHTAAYPVEHLGGMIWAYLGPLPAPLIPRLDGFVVEPAIRTVSTTRIACNWLQIMENSVDPVHTEWLHGKFFEFINEKNNVKVAYSRHHAKIAFDEAEYGIIKRRLMDGQSEDAADWAVGHPLVFPNILAFGSSDIDWRTYALQIRVPIDDETTEHYWYNTYEFPEGTEIPADLLGACPAYEISAHDANGDYALQYVFAQDVMAWEMQGQIAKRHLEHLASHDRGVTMFRNMLKREIKNVEAGRDPMWVLRDPAHNAVIELPHELRKDVNAEGFENLVMRNMVAMTPLGARLVEFYKTLPGRVPAAV